MTLCKICKKNTEGLPFKCKFCQDSFCTHHRLPENHNCVQLAEYKKQKIEMQKKMGSALKNLNKKEYDYDNEWRQERNKFARLQEEKESKARIKYFKKRFSGNYNPEEKEVDNTPIIVIMTMIIILIILFIIIYFLK